MKGFFKEDEYLWIQAINANNESFDEMYSTEWTEQEAVKELLLRPYVIDEYIVEINVRRVKRYITKMHK